MRSVYKYVIPFEEEPLVAVHEGAQPVHVDNQREQLCLWAVVDLDMDPPLVDKQFRVAGTGQEFEDGWTHLGSALFQGGSLVFHLFVAEADTNRGSL